MPLQTLREMVVVETAYLASNGLASWVIALPIEPPMAGARTVFPGCNSAARNASKAANDLDLRSTTINE